MNAGSPKSFLIRVLLVTFFTTSVFALTPELSGQDAGWGHLKGKLVVQGEVPAPDDITLSTKDKQYCIDTGQEYKSRKLLVGSDGQLQDAYVLMYFHRSDPKRPEVHPSYDEETEVSLDNVNCRFEPRAIFVRTGQSIKFKNSDRIGHNCHIATMTFEDNCSLGAGQSLDVECEEPCRYPGIVKCDAHPWMEARLLIRDEPYVAITGADGTFEIKNIPAGEWTFQFWHANPGNLKGLEKDGKSFVGRRGEVKVTIPDGDTLDLGDLTIAADMLKED